MRARDLAVEYESVSVDSGSLDAARLMAEHNLYVIEDPTFAAVVDEPHADRLCEALADDPRYRRAMLVISN
ncbi:hypothetical protein [Streptomyces sp. NL15-2K]|uniref:hypothetical protein n=1 Tax=Streptomyces sp. NL15-2K TaxID=376149 RepID=UPI000F568A40|nr:MULTISPECIES: hypothetical protein [Actinomycetes]WKX13892.1 hypothetical protein Q4V64_42755 [Kutzneria buriramensis]GCB52035.1 hypothetical protein SNL152K_9391 [Streptomyces sp. NL15-2K]